MSDTNELKEIEKNMNGLINEVNECWKKNMVFLLAKVKPFLIREGVDVDRILNGRSFRDFFTNSVPQLKIIQHEREPTNWGLIPADANPHFPYSQYFIKKTQKLKTQQAFPYQNALKLAFTRPIDEGKRRWVFISPTRYLDLPTSDAPEHAVEINRNFIEEHANEERSRNLIAHWIEENGLEPEPYQYTKSSSLTKTRVPRSLLHQIILSLLPEDLNRISLPLDIVKKLLEKPGE